MLELTIQNILCLSLLLYSRRITLHVTILFCLFIFVNILGFFFVVPSSILFDWDLRVCVRQSKCGPCSFLLTQEAKIEVTLSSWIWHTYKYQVCIIFIVMMPMPGHYITYNKFSFHHHVPFLSLSLSRPSINLFDIVIVIIIITHRTIVFRFHAPIDLHTFRSISAFWDSNNIKYFLVLL